MQEYRICVAANGQIKQRIEFRAPHDQAALEYVRQHMTYGDEEIWVERVVGNLKPVRP